MSALSPKRSRRRAFVLVSTLLLAASPCRAQTETAEPKPAPPPPEARVSNVPMPTVKLAYQHSITSLHHVGMIQDGVSLGVGAQRAQFAVYMLAEVELGHTARGLSTNHESLGAEVLWRATSFWRLGGGAYFERLAVKRITKSGSLEGFGFGAFLSTEVDLYRFGPRDDHGFFLGLRGSDDGFGTQALLEARFMAGFRY